MKKRKNTLALMCFALAAIGVLIYEFMIEGTGQTSYLAEHWYVYVPLFVIAAVYLLLTTKR